jgi:hypothetical protein
MALIHGNGDVPCPVCLVAKEKMNTGAVGTLRTTGTMKGIYDQATPMGSTERNKFLQGYGLRYVEVCHMNLIYDFII